MLVVIFVVVPADQRDHLAVDGVDAFHDDAHRGLGVEDVLLLLETPIVSHAAESVVVC